MAIATRTYSRVDGWLNVSQTAKLLDVAASSVSRALERPEFSGARERFGAHELRLSPTLVLELAQYFKTLPLSEVGGAIVSHAEEIATAERASEIEAEVQAFIDRQPVRAPGANLTEAHERFLAVARSLVPAETYQELEAAYRATHGA